MEFHIFYTPVSKTGRIMVSTRLSVRMFRFRTLSSKCFIVSTSNFGKSSIKLFHRSSSLSVMIRRIWPTFWPKVGQTYFCHSWPHFLCVFILIWNINCPWWLVQHKLRVLRDFEISNFDAFFYVSYPGPRTGIFCIIVQALGSVCVHFSFTVNFGIFMNHDM